MMQKGFTLIELLIYIAIVGAIAAGFIRFSLSISDSGSKSFVVQEVHGNGRVALDLISQRIRAATGVNTGSSTFGSDPGVLSLVMADAAKNPTVINLTADNGVLQIKEGSSSAVAITSSEVQITNLVFTNLTPTGARENIRFQLTVAYNDSSGDVEYTYSKSFQTAVSVRQ